MRPRLTSRLTSRLASRPTPRPVAVRTLAVALATASALLMAGCSSSSSSSSDANTSYVQGSGAITTVDQGHRGAPLSLSGKTLDNQQLNLASFRGKVVVINVWGSWCAPCNAEAADFESVYKANEAKGVQFLGIDTRDTQIPAAQQFVSDHGLTYPSLYDPDGELLLDFPTGSLNPQSIPSTIILDRGGHIAVRALGGLTADQLSTILAPVVAEKS